MIRMTRTETSHTHHTLTRRMLGEQSFGVSRWSRIDGVGEQGSKEKYLSMRCTIAICKWCTYTGEADTTVTTFGSCRELFDMVVYEFSTGGFHNPSAVRGGVIGLALAESNTLGHCRICKQRLISQALPVCFLRTCDRLNHPSSPLTVSTHPRAHPLSYTEKITTSFTTNFHFPVSPCTLTEVVLTLT